MEYYARKSKLNVSCHRLRHTMATQLLNADADISTIQDLLGHTHITTTQRYCRVSNLKIQRDYYKAMELVIQRTMQQRHRRTAELEENHSVLVLRQPSEESLDTRVRLVHPEDNSPCTASQQATTESEKSA